MTVATQAQVDELLAMRVTTRPEAEAFIEQLVALGLDYHFDDGAVDCLHGNEDENGFPLLTLEEAVIVDIKVADCYDCFAASGADLSVDCPIGHSLKAQGL